jgi:PBSX family phage terminase large subunit
MIEYSDKQRELLHLWQAGQLKRINILEGSVRSGKTWITLVLWAFWVATMPEDGSYLMVAKTLTSLRRNCLDLLEKLVGSKNFTYSIPKKEARLFGRLVYLEGVNDARAESKIRGMTLQGALCDELTLFTEDFFAMLLSRLSLPGAKLFGSTNPDHPNHWLMVNYIKRQEELDMLVLKFLIDDNPALDPEYVKQLKREYTGVFYRRYILGEWCLAEGLVYEFDEERQTTTEIPESGKYFISCDYGTLNPFSAGLWCVKDGRAVRIREYYYSGRERAAQKTDEEYYAELEKLAGDLPVRYVVVDPSAASFMETIRRHGKFSVRKARNEVLPGIRLTAMLLKAGRIFIHKDCKDAIREFGLYCWDDKGEVDKPLKVNDHAMDDIRYFCSTVLRRELRNIPELRGIAADEKD